MTLQRIIITCILFELCFIYSLALQTKCCICDDEDDDLNKHCTFPDVCGHNTGLCDFCETRKQFKNNSWLTKRRCADENACIADLQHTASQPACPPSTGVVPARATTCYTCCRSPSPFKPLFCIKAPDTNNIEFKTTAGIVTTKTTTTSVTSTTNKVTSTPQTPSTVNSNAVNDAYCQVGHGAPYTVEKCDPTTPFCMNTVVVNKDFTIVKKSCETQILCLYEWVYSTSGRVECLHTDINTLVPTEHGLVCHYCCNASNGSVCNMDDVPKEAQVYITNKFVDGGWSMWNIWTGCTSTCGGKQTRTRTCSRPYPAQYGSACKGEPRQERQCDTTNCQASTSDPNMIG